MLPSRWLVSLAFLLLPCLPGAAREFAPGHPVVQAFSGKRLDLWSVQPISASQPPAKPDWGSNEIDAFLADIYAKAGVTPSAPLVPRALCRRLYFDLTGLPPQPQEVQSFEKEWTAWEESGRTTADPVAALADRLLDSDASAAHLSGWWLDLVRYADSTGYDWDELRRESWRYRDYVIRSFRADKPYDQFVREQLAGDELVPDEPADQPQQDALLATGFLRVGPWDNSAKLFGEEHRTRAQWMSDLAETTGTAFLGITFSCCRCHDHKTDPLTQQDYYRFQAFFAPLEFRDDHAVDLAAEQLAIRTANAALEQQAKPHHDAIATLRDTARTRLRKGERKKKVSDEEADKAMTAGETEARKEHERLAAEIEAGRRSFTTALLAGSGKARETHVLKGGNPDEAGALVEAGIPAIFTPAGAEAAAPATRTALADWIVSPQNPLTSRVLANRLWHLVFGEGLVSTLDDFGFAGQPPAAPELLDWLAAELPRRGWSIRQMLRLMVTSAAYRQAPRADAALPGMRTLRRLTAEQLRDAMLSVSGALLPDISGPPVWPELPADVLQANPAFLDDNETKTKGWYPSPADRQGVRSVLLVRKRSVKVPFLETFDLPENFQSCGRRRVSTVAPQALVLMSSTFAEQTATAFAARVTAEAGADAAAQLHRAWQLAFGREPEEKETDLLLPLWQKHGAVAGCRVLFNLNEFIYAD